MGNLYLLLVAFLLLCASCKNTKTDNNDIAEKICLNFIEKDKNLIIPDSLTNLVDGTLFNTNNTCDSGIMLILLEYLQPIITQYFIDNKSEIWLLFLIAHSKR